MSGDNRKYRVVELQRQIKLAKDALIKIAHGCRDPEGVASDTLTAMMPTDPKAPLQAIVGHGR